MTDHLRGHSRRALARLAAVVCPPASVENLHVVAGFEAQFASLPASARRLVGPALFLFNQGARLDPRNGGRSFVHLGDARADAYLRRVLYGRTGPLATGVRLIKSLVVMAYYELPEVKAGLGYDPAAYIAEVTARRLERHGTDIRSAEKTSSGGDSA